MSHLATEAIFIHEQEHPWAAVSGNLQGRKSKSPSDHLLSEVPPSFRKRGVLEVILLPRTVCKHHAVDKRVIFPFYCKQRGQTSSSS